MRFPLAEQLVLPCRFEGVLPGRLHPDGRRYLPLILLRLPASGGQAWIGGGSLLAVVDRHHRVDQALAGRAGHAQLVFLLSTIRLQMAPVQLGLQPETKGDQPSLAPTIYGQVRAVPHWDVEREHLPYQALSTELLLDVGAGVVGVRTSTTAADLAATLGKAQLAAGDWISVSRSRIDILGFMSTND